MSYSDVTMYPLPFLKKLLRSLNLVESPPKIFPFGTLFHAWLDIQPLLRGKLGFLLNKERSLTHTESCIWPPSDGMLYNH